jgi:hypothetical protein
MAMAVAMAAVDLSPDLGQSGDAARTLVASGRRGSFLVWARGDGPTSMSR